MIKIVNENLFKKIKINSLLLKNKKILYNRRVRITHKNYYLGAIASVEDFRKTTLNSKLLFHEDLIQKISVYIRDHYIRPAVTCSYLTIKTLSSKLISVSYPSLGHYLKKGWIDTFSFKFIEMMIQWLQGITEPIANCASINFPLLKQISQSVIGFARFTDVERYFLNSLNDR